MPLYPNYPVAPLSWFRTGGYAKTFLKADTIEELRDFMKHPTDFYVVGNGSNTLFQDGIINRTIVKLGKGFRGMTHDQNTVTLGAGCLNRTAVEQTCAWGLSGLEFLIGVPGTIGGAVAMNAGVLNEETKDILTSLQVILPGGELQHIPAKNLTIHYRHTELPQNSIVIDATFALQPSSSEAIRQKIQNFLSHRDEAQPTGGKTGGSTFKNPPGHRAWALIDAVGLRGYRIGGAAFSEKHCNFIMNTDGTASDIEALGELARQKVLEKFGINLEWEIKTVK